MTAKIVSASNTPYTIWVDEYDSNTGGPYTMYVSVVDADAAPDTSCDAAVLLLDQDYLFQNSLVGDTGAYNLSECNTTAGPEHTYVFRLPKTATVVATVLGNTGGVAGNADKTVETLNTPVLHVTSGACGPTVSGCVAGSLGVATFSSVLTAGDYTFFVDSPGVTGDLPVPYLFAIHADATVADNNTCSGDIPVIDLDALGRGSVTGQAIDLGIGHDTGSCATMAGPERIYAVDVPPNRLLTVTTSPVRDGLFGTLAPSVYIRSDCLDPASQLACVTTSTKGASVVAIAQSGDTPRRMYIFVDSTDPLAVGSFNLDIGLGHSVELPENDACLASGQPFPSEGGSHLSFNNMVATATGSLELAGNDSSGTCAAMNGPDRVYSFEVLTEAAVRITASATSFTPSVYFRAACDAVAEYHRTGCGKGDPTTMTAESFVGYVPPGIYYLWIDTADASAPGSYWIDVQLEAPTSPPQPQPGGCDNIRRVELDPVTSTYVVTESIGLDWEGSTTTGLCSEGTTSMIGPEVVYELNLAADFSKVTIQTTGESGQYFYVRDGECTDASWRHERGCQAQGGASSMTFYSLPRGNYFIFVDSLDHLATFEYEMTISVEVAVPVPANDRIDGAVTLTAGAPVAGDLTYATNDYTFFSATGGNGCEQKDWFRGPELVYTYTTGNPPSMFYVMVSPTITQTLNAAIWIGTDCTPDACVRGVNDNNTTSSEYVMMLEPLPNQTYCIMVETPASGPGATFNIEVVEF